MAPVLVESRIDVPANGRHIDAGGQTIAGVAWAPIASISRVEVQVDDGPWQPATLGAVPSVDTWRQWSYRWEARAGKHRLQVRATDNAGEAQPESRVPPFPDGATGWHTIEVTVG